jgi:hypothetical protein
LGEFNSHVGHELNRSIICSHNSGIVDLDKVLTRKEFGSECLECDPRYLELDLFWAGTRSWHVGSNLESISCQFDPHVRIGTHDLENERRSSRPGLGDVRV